MTTLKRQARTAGFLYLVLGLIAPIGLMIVPGEIVVYEDAAATAENIRNSEGLLRLGIASELVHQVIVIFLVLALHRLFKQVDEMLARQVVILGALVSVPIMFVNVLNSLAALTLAQGPEFLAPIGRSELDALSYLFIRLHSLGITVASVFWGLWLFPFGLLVIRCRFIPPFLGYLLFVAGTAYLVAAFTRLWLPAYEPLVSKFAVPLYVAEVPIIFWLVIWGARNRSGQEAVSPA